MADAGLELAEQAAKAAFRNDASEVWHALKSKPEVQYRSADGVKGVICRNAVTGKPFFRIYTGDGHFEDYDLHHDELSVKIDDNAMAALYRCPDRSSLDHNPQVLGIDDTYWDKSGDSRPSEES
jgi:hypothetical protein